MEEVIKNAVVNALNEIGNSIWEGIKYTLIQSTGTIALIGGGICIIMQVAGWDKGFKTTGILFVIHVLVQYLLG